ncbi:hypothetical protein C0431_13195 [bacterium]|nr:hypothetical protein [bacterium]
MAMFPGIKGPIPSTDKVQNRTNTKLVSAQHDSPGEEFIVDPRLKQLFAYHFGGNGHVVMPKGRAVAIATDKGNGFVNGQLKSKKTGKLKPVLTLANGGKDSLKHDTQGKEYTHAANTVIGLAAGNIYEQMLDGWDRMQPTIENEKYVELPYLPKKEDAEKLEWGVVYDADATRALKPGDQLVPDENGRLVAADFEKIREGIEAAADLTELKALLKEESRLRDQVVGSVWALETEMPMEGFLGWVGWTDEQVAEDDWKMRTSGPSTDRGATDFPGYPYEQTYKNFDVNTNKYYPQGIPGLTNGSNIEVEYTDELVGYVNPGQEGRHDFRIAQTPIVQGSYEFKFGADPIEPLYVDLQSGRVAFTAPKNNTTEPIAITATFKATGQIPGVPTNADFKGSAGLVRILLSK